MARIRTKSRRRTARCALLASLIAPSPSWAEPAAPEQASQHFEQGYRLAQEGRLEAAIGEFQQAYALKPHPQVLYNLGQAYAASGRAVEAVDTLTHYLSESTDATTERRASVVALIAYQKQRVGSLLLVVEPAGSDVVLDGAPIGKAPLGPPVRLTAGFHTVFVTSEGHTPKLERVEVVGQTQATLHVTLQPAVTSVGAPTVDDPAARRELAQLHDERAKRRRIQLISALVSGGLGAASLTAAAVLYATNQPRYEDWRQDAQEFASRLESSSPPTAREFDNLLDRQNELRNRDAATLGLAVFGGVMVAGAAALWLTLPSKEPARLNLSLGPTPWLSYSQAF